MSLVSEKQFNELRLVCSQSSSDLPLLVTVRDLGRRLLSSLQSSDSDYSPNSPRTATSTSGFSPRQGSDEPVLDDESFRIGFITPPFRDNKIPVTDHLHAHAYILPADLMGWWRSVAYGTLAWYSVDDLIAEIRYVCYSYFSRRLLCSHQSHGLPHCVLRLP